MYKKIIGVVVTALIVLTMGAFLVVSVVQIVQPSRLTVEAAPTPVSLPIKVLGQREMGYDNFKVLLVNGVPCVIYQAKSGYAGGISCDFDRGDVTSGLR